MVKLMEQWIRTDEGEDVAGSIRHALRCFGVAAHDDQEWKWAALALHAALQGSCICHLVTTASPVGAVTERNAGEWLRYFEALRSNPSALPPQTYLMILPDLLKKIRKPHSAGDGSNKAGISVSDQDLAWLRRFHETIRNQFIHFEPVGWSLEVCGLRDLARLIARIITEVLNVGWAFRHKDQAWQRELAANLLLLAFPGERDANGALWVTFLRGHRNCSA